MHTVGIGKQNYESLIMSDCFYVDKTYFIKQWWESQDDVTLITRPRRFGKTLNMSMLNCFFSNKYMNRADLFEKFEIWTDEKYRKLQGTYPVINLSFADVKDDNFKNAKNSIISVISDVYRTHSYLIETDEITDAEKGVFKALDAYSNNTNINKEISEDVICRAIKNLSFLLERYYGKKVLIFLDEYDTPLQEAYLGGYWDEMVGFMRVFFNATFKTNPYLDRAIMTGITRISKESMFSDLNNLRIVSTTSNMYETCFGFTEDEVFKALDEVGISDRKEDVKQWYDGFSFGKSKDIYNPWSITNFIDERKLKTYWVDTSSNELAGKLIQSASPEVKKSMEKLLNGESITVDIDEQIVFNQLDYDENAIWSLFLASGYLKVENAYDCEISGKYELSLTNLEVRIMFQKLISGWFKTIRNTSDEFVIALIKGDIKAMNYFMNKIALATFSYFDVGNKPSEYIEPERFYHGFVLGIMVGERENYIIKSNRESGFGRYDIMMVPKDIKNKKLPAIVIEFKVYDSEDEKQLKDTVKAAHRQIEEKRYDDEIIQLGIEKDRIKHYGFAFEGKKVLIG
ncbi:AAA family ATPase [Butyribacter sp.]|uniref:AAA family ATPase n=1 Tax=Butyribacter sp. TaxID=2822465 RepID=UPI002A9219AB|nr:AAA family ATPase [Butyribacter sp.]